MKNQVNAACEQGSLRGIVTNGVNIFYDIPYAETGGRFADAKPPREWPETRDCSSPGPIFPQPPSRLDFVQGPYSTGLEQSEDAFRLNIYTPDCKGSLPVLFWIHGGGFTTGGCALQNYSGAPLAASGRCVVVAVNYRLGILGNLYIPGLSDGMQSVKDLQSALFWVKRNIHNFGGDPNSLVVSGQSAGGWYSKLLIGMESTSAVISGAVILSAPSLNPLSTDEASNLAREFCKFAGVTDPDQQLPELSLPDLLEAQARLVASKADYGTIAVATLPVQGGEIPKDLVEASAYFAPKPIIIGWTREEPSAFFASDPQMIKTPEDKVVGKYKEIFGVNGALRYSRSVQKHLLGTPYSALVELVADQWFKSSSLRTTNLLSRAGAQVYVYQFDYQSVQPNLGACHCFDIPFWLGNFDESKDGPMLDGLDMSEAEALSSLMQEYLLNFLHSGNPNSAELPVWQPSRNGEIQTLHFDEYISCTLENDLDGR